MILMRRLCPFCHTGKVTRKGTYKNKEGKFFCKKCGKNFLERKFRGVNCTECKHLEHSPIDDIERWCSKRMFERFPYIPITECKHYERP